MSLATAKAFLQANDLHSAEREYRAILKLDQKNHEAIHYLGYIAFMAGFCDTAVEFFRRSIVLAPKNIDYRNNLGATLQNMEHYAEALTVYETALRLFPKSKNLLNNIGTLYQVTGRPDEALRYFRLAMDQDFDDLTTRCNMAAAMAAMEKYTEAAFMYEKVLDINPDHPIANYFLGFIRQRQGHLFAGWALYEWRWHPEVQKIQQPTILENIL